MKKLIILASTLALAACGGANDDAAVDDVVVADDTVVASEDTTGVAGTYQMTQADGTIVTQTVNADGTYVDTAADGTELQRGTWRTEGEALCFDDTGPAVETCMTGGEVSEDGSFRAIGADGQETGTIVRKIG